MLTTIIYRSHICEDVPVKALEAMVAAANRKNRQSNVTGILLFNGTHFFQLLEGPVQHVSAIYEQICNDPKAVSSVARESSRAQVREYAKEYLGYLGAPRSLTVKGLGQERW